MNKGIKCLQSFSIYLYEGRCLRSIESKKKCSFNALGYTLVVLEVL